MGPVHGKQLTLDLLGPGPNLNRATQPPLVDPCQIQLDARCQAVVGYRELSLNLNVCGLRGFEFKYEVFVGYHKSTTSWMWAKLVIISWNICWSINFP